MKKLKKSVSTLAILFACSACGMNKNPTTYFDFPHMHKGYRVGQIIEKYSDPEKIEIVYTPACDEIDFQYSEAASISTEMKQVLETAIKAKIGTIDPSIKAKLTESYKIHFTDVWAEWTDKVNMFEYYKKLFDSDEKPFLEEYLKAYREDGVAFDIFSLIVHARVSIEKLSNGTISFDEKIKIGEALSADFAYNDESNKIITSEEIIPAGHHADPCMISKIFGDDKRSCVGKFSFF